MPSGESVGWLGCMRLESVPGSADGVVAVGGDADLAGAVDQVQVGHQLGHGGDHLGGQAGGDAADHLAAVVVSASSHSRSSPTVQSLISP